MKVTLEFDTDNPWEVMDAYRMLVVYLYRKHAKPPVPKPKERKGRDE